MDDRQRRKNELQFDHWEELTSGGRVYSFEIPGKMGWSARYLKEVDQEEKTVRFWQEIYDDKKVLREIHEKYPIDKGHKKVNGH